MISLAQTNEGPDAAFPVPFIAVRPEPYRIGKLKELTTFRRAVQPAQRRFRAQIRIPGFGYTIPAQDFTEARGGSKIVISSAAPGKWPNLRITFTDAGPASLPIYESLDVVKADDSTDAWLLWTRIAWSIKAGQGLVIEDDEGVLVGLAYDDDEMFQELQNLASIIRKLKYIEGVFNRCFSIPDEFQPEDVYRTEVVFRALTEGEFSMRGRRFTAPQMKPANFRMNEPPFSGPGPFLVESKTEEEQTTELLGNKLNLGPVAVTLHDSVVVNRSLLRQLDPASQEPVTLRFVVRDNQIHYRFANYAGPHERKQNQQRFTQFRNRLLSEEPNELVSLVDESLQPDVSSEEAMRIGMAWLIYNNFPDRYSSQRPMRHRQSGYWLVPVWLAYSNGTGGPVGELQVDVRTGAVADHTPIQQMRERGAALAETLLNA